MAESSLKVGEIEGYQFQPCKNPLMILMKH